MSSGGVKSESLHELYTYSRIDPATGETVPGRYLWTPIDKDRPQFEEPLVCNPAPTELLLAPSLPRSKDEPLAATGRLIEPDEQEAKQLEEQPGIRSLLGVCNQYVDRCTCGTAYQNNCAHYLANAFILAGYSDLTTSSIITARCPHRRPIRAQDMLRWFQSKQTGFNGARIQRNTGIWATYQETSGWQHVVVIDTNRWLYFGTGDYYNWPVQWNYRMA